MSGILTKGEFTYGSPILRGNHSNVTIGRYCSIAENCIFDCGFNHNRKFVSTYPFDVNMFMPHLPPNRPPVKDITIGNDVWLGEGCMIMQNVTIGDGAVIGARTIVTRSVMPYAIVVGNCRVTGYRFTDEQIKRLLDLKWWNWPEDRVKRNAHLLLQEDIDYFLNNYLE